MIMFEVPTCYCVRWLRTCVLSTRNFLVGIRLRSHVWLRNDNFKQYIKQTIELIAWCSNITLDEAAVKEIRNREILQLYKSFTEWRQLVCRESVNLCFSGGSDNDTAIN